MQALGSFLRCLLHGFLHAHGDDAFGQIHAASLELCHGGSLQVDDLDNVQRKPGVLLREAHGLVKRRASGIGPIERDHNGIVEHCNPLLSPVEPGKARRRTASPSPSGFIPSIARSPATIAAGLPQTPLAQAALPCCNVSRTRRANRPTRKRNAGYTSRCLNASGTSLKPFDFTAPTIRPMISHTMPTM